MKKSKYLFVLSILSTLCFSSCSNSNKTMPIEPVDPDDPEEYEIIETFSKRMPAEFEPVEYVKLVYPYTMSANVYKTISDTNKVLLLCDYDDYGRSRVNEAKSSLKNAGCNLSNITFLDMACGYDYECWIRDCSPFYVFDEKELSIVDFTYNRSSRVEQNRIPSKLADYFQMSYSKMDIVHTGGNLMQDGRGRAFSDDLVLSENNNRESLVLSEMEEHTGTEDYVITIDPQGDYIAHVDCWAKIVAPDKIIVAQVPNSHARYNEYEEVASLLGNTKCAYGYNYKIYRVLEQGDDDIAAPYTNSLIANNYVYVPMGDDETYNQNALSVYREALPGYTVIGVYNNDLGWPFYNTDALHCRSHEVPDQDMVFIDSREVLNGEVEEQDSYLVKSNIVTYSNSELKEVKIYYSINGGSYQSASLNQYQNTTNYTYIFTNLNSGDVVSYYLEASDEENNKQVDPSCGANDPFTFTIE